MVTFNKQVNKSLKLNRSLIIKCEFKLDCKTSLEITRIKRHMHNNDRNGILASCIAFI